MAVISTLLATQFSALMAPTIDSLPASVPEGAKEAARQSVGGATVVFQEAAAAGAPASVVEQWQSEAFAAFISASHVTSLVSAVMVLIAAVVVATLLPHISPPQAAADVAPAAHTKGAVHEVAQDSEEAAKAAAAELELDYAGEAAEEYVGDDGDQQAPSPRPKEPT